MQSPFLSRKNGLPIRDDVLLYTQLIHSSWTMHALSGCVLPEPMSGSCRWYNPSVSALQQKGFSMQATSKSRGFKGFIFYKTHPSSNCFDSKLAGAGNPLWQLGRTSAK